MKPKRFATEADLCAAFLAWVARQHPDVRCYSEWAGWDILVVYPQGLQLGIQAKLRLNADVILQAAPEFRWGTAKTGPDFRAVLVPERNPLSAAAARVGLEVFYPDRHDWDHRPLDFYPSLDGAHGNLSGGRFDESDWLDWNPEERHELPPTATDAIAGSPCPVSLTHWKLGALRVLAELEVNGTITSKRMREIGINPSRWTTARWLEPVEPRGTWVRGANCPTFDEQHPTAYAHALELARKTA
jgi:hypothetical protein